MTQTQTQTPSNATTSASSTTPKTTTESTKLRDRIDAAYFELENARRSYAIRHRKAEKSRAALRDATDLLILSSQKLPLEGEANAAFIRRELAPMRKLLRAAIDREYRARVDLEIAEDRVDWMRLTAAVFGVPIL